MLHDEWLYTIEHSMPFTPTSGQREAITVISRYLASLTTHSAAMPHDGKPLRATVSQLGGSIMLLRGYAGTGKTSVARAVVAAMRQMGRKVVLLAPTGRAAKVLSAGTGMPAYTIHRKIYRQQAYMSARFTLNDNLHADTVFLVDEASMISNQPSYADSGATATGSAYGFGSGSLLDDLVSYVRQGRGCSMILVGDTAQLPPVGSPESPALSTTFMSGYGWQVFDYDLSEVLRQSATSGILQNATMLRQMIDRDHHTLLPVIRLQGYADITVCHGNDLIETLATAYSRSGQDETIVITRSNKRANIYNLGIRNQVLWREEELSSGDQLMIVKNNYHWTADQKDPAVPSFLANGDRCIVRRVRNEQTLYGFRFADVLLTFPDYDDYELQATVLLDTLHSESPALTTDQQNQLYENIMADYADITQKAERHKLLRADRYFNALQVKYAYAVTCHKAQGGQWSEVFLDQGYVTDDMLTPAYLHWLYTAFTRATRHLHLINWPDKQIDNT